MEFNFNTRKALMADQEGYSLVDCTQLKPVYQHHKQHSKENNHSHFQQLAQIIDSMGKNSSIAQNLKTQITTYQKCLNENQKIFFKLQDQKVQGFLKIGYKKLFYHNAMGKIVELYPLCVLDFYVHESVQRGGIGKYLFTKMIEHTKVEPAMIAYDRPSKLLISFLRKHYNLNSFIPQNNNYVVFDNYFDQSSQNNQRPPSQISNKNNNFKQIGQRVLQEQNYEMQNGYSNYQYSHKQNQQDSIKDILKNDLTNFENKINQRDYEQGLTKNFNQKNQQNYFKNNIF